MNPLALVRSGDLTEPPWERQPDESPRAFSRFEMYRALGPTRALSQISTGGWVKRLAARYHWHRRAVAWDAHLAEVRQQEAEEQTRELTRELLERHGSQIKAMLQVLTLPAVVLLRRMADPEQREAVMNMGGIEPRELMRLAQASAGALPDLQAAERVLRGLPANIEEHRHVQQEAAPPITPADLLADEQTSDMASALFARIQEQRTGQ
jgi:hypothetical protein